MILKESTVDVVMYKVCMTKLAICQRQCTDTSMFNCVIRVSCTQTFQLLPMLMMSCWATAIGRVAHCTDSRECTLEAVLQWKSAGSYTRVQAML